jgi:hypothetical protein
MVGSVSFNIPVSKITTEPFGILTSLFYALEGKRGYQPVDELKPGLGYWVKASQSGKVAMNVYSSAATAPPVCSPMPTVNPPGAPSIPILNLPANSSTGITRYPTLTWRTSEGAISYHLQISTNSCFTNIVLNDSTIIDTSKQVSLSYSTSYFWRVSAMSSTAKSAWSTLWNFITTAGPQIDPCNPVESFANMDNLTILDAEGGGQKMFVHNGHRAIDVGMNDFEMPPMPPKNSLNVKFQSNKFIETVPPNNKIYKMPVSIKNAKYPIKITWDIKQQNGIQYWLIKSNNNNEKVALQGSGEISLNKVDDNSLIIEAQAVAPPPCDYYKADIKNLPEENVKIPTMYKLEQNSPNPFNPTTVINYQLPENCFVTLKVYDVLGKEVAELVNEYKEAGNYNSEWDASSFSSGVYIYKLSASSYISVKKMLLVR